MTTKKTPVVPSIPVVMTRHTGWVNMPDGPPAYLLDGAMRRADDPVVAAHPHYFQAVQDDQERPSHRA